MSPPLSPKHTVSISPTGTSTPIRDKDYDRSISNKGIRPNDEKDDISSVVQEHGNSGRIILYPSPDRGHFFFDGSVMKLQSTVLLNSIGQ